MAGTRGGATVGVDIGGTFTDVVLATGEGEVVTTKVPTTAPPDIGAIDGIERATDIAGIAVRDICTITHGTTIATNALLAREGPPTALVTTAGTRDVLEIGRQRRPSLYDLHAQRSPPIIERHRRIELEERIVPSRTNDGVEVEPPTQAELHRVCDRIKEMDVAAVAVVLLHAYAESSTERLVVDHLRDELDVPVRPSHEVHPEIREYERTATTAACAFLTPLIDRYLSRFEEFCEAHDIDTLSIMQSNGGIATPQYVRDRAVSIALSGPVAGVMRASHVVSNTLDATEPNAISLDMGGTSADIGIIERGTTKRTNQLTIGDVPVQTRAVDIETVGAGGGSIAWVDDGGALRVGPRSAGADPGPACYGRGGTEPTVTDAALTLGYLGEETDLGEAITLDTEKATSVLETLQIDRTDPVSISAGIVQVATETMAQAIRRSAVERGHDPRTFALVAFGGAGGLFGAPLATALDIDRVILPADAGVLSAAGLLTADERYDVAQSTLLELETGNYDEIEDTFRSLESDVRDRCSQPNSASITRQADCRYRGQSYELTIPADKPVDIQRLRDRLHDHHERQRGYQLDEPIELVTCRASASVSTDAVGTTGSTGEPTLSTREMIDPGGETWVEATIVQGDPVTPFDGPAIIERPQSTAVVPSGWQARPTSAGSIVLTRGESA